MASNYVTIEKTIVTKEKITKKEARIRVAKDVLKWLKLGELSLIPGEYLSDNLNNLPEAGCAKANIEKLKTCNVCALGAMFLGQIDIFNKIQIEDVFRYDYKKNLCVRDEVMREKLKDIFDINQQCLIECAFEIDDRSGQDDDTVTEEQIENAKAFGAQYIRPRQRLQAIMENVIKNKGVFKP